MLHIRLLGSFQLTYKGQPYTAVQSVRVQALLAYLALQAGTAQTRRHLAFLFWPDSTEEQAHTNLRKLLHSLRQSLPNPDAYLAIERTTVLWQKAAPYWLDVAELTDLLYQLEQTPGDGALPARVAALYRGDLLLGCYDDWLLLLREQYRQRVQGALERLVIWQEEQRAYAEGLRYAHQLLTLDPLAETTYQHLMRLYALQGDRSAALRSYHECVKMLQRELGVEPSEATQQIYQRILNRDLQTGTAPVKPPALLPETVSLVGRQDEWQLLQAAWQQAAAGQTQFVAICGEAGIGKSRLAAEYLHWASHQGILTAQARSHEAQGALAYAPVAELLRTEAISKRLAGLDAVWLTEVARLLPTLLAQRPTLPHPQPLTESWQRLRFFEALARAIIGEDQPLLLLFDDLQWCDQETLAWLHYLFSHYNHRRILVIGTVRDDELNKTHAFVGLQTALNRAGQLTQIKLAPLNATETTTLATQLATSDLTAAQATELYSATAGNPLFVVETLRAGSRQAIDPTNQATRTGLPPKVYAVLQYRLTQLSPLAQQVAALAAVLGRSFSYAVLHAALGQEEDKLVDTLDELWQRRIIIERGATYDFSHDRLRDVAYAEISGARRRLLHRRVAEALAAIHASDLRLVYGQLAAHYDGAGMTAAAVAYYQQAGDQAQQLYARHEALSYYARALALAEGNDVVPAILTSRAQLLLDLYEGHAAAADYERLRQQARTQNDPKGELAALLGLGWAHYIIAMDQPDSAAVAGAWDWYEGAYQVAKRLGDIHGMVRARVGIRYHVMFSHAYADQSQAHIDEALALSRAVGDEELVLDSVLAAIHFRKPIEWEREGEAQLARFPQPGDRTKWTELNFLLLVIHGLRGNFARAVAYGDTCIGLAIESGVPPVQYPSYKAIALIQLGRYDTAWASLQQEVVDQNHPFSRTYKAFVTALYLIDTLAYEQAVALLEGVVEEATQLRRPWLRDLALVHLSRALALSTPGASQTLCARDQELAAMSSTLLARIVGQPSVARGEIALALGRPAAALQPVDEGMLAAASEGRLPDLLMGQEVKARLLLQLARAEEALSTAEEALTLATSMQAAPLIWRLHEARARALQQLDRPAEARQGFQLATTLIHTLAAAIPEPALKAGFLAHPRVSSIIAMQATPS
jgi:DNA-binding SARP family transcriptional activator/tetratricopeptide (TPR) repeat protein